MAERLEMAIPKWSGEVVFYIAFSIIFAFATLLAVLNLLFQVSIVASCLWLALIVWLLRNDCRYAGGFRKWLIQAGCIFAGKQFVESLPQDSDSVEIRFGYRLFGRRLLNFKVPLHKIETVEWQPGQAPRDWIVYLWYDHDDPEKAEARQKWSRKLDQEVYCVGPARSRKRTETLGLAFVDFLRRAGAPFVQGKDECAFVRAVSRAANGEEHPAT